MRYIIEAAAEQARILDRTLIIPSFVYARSCEYDMCVSRIIFSPRVTVDACICDSSSVCSDHFEMVNRGDAIGSDQWRYLPPAQQMAYRIPITTMLDLTLLREVQPVILVSDYLQLHGLPLHLEQSNGTWSRDAYHSNSNVYTGRKPSFHEIKNNWYDPSGTIRVDRLPDEIKERGKWRFRMGDDETGPIGEWTTGESESEVAESLRSMSQSRSRLWLEWEEAVNAMTDALQNSEVAETDRKFEEIAHDHGWETVYTYQRV